MSRILQAIPSSIWCQLGQEYVAHRGTAGLDQLQGPRWAAHRQECPACRELADWTPPARTAQCRRSQDGGRRPPARTAQCRRSQDGGRRPSARTAQCRRSQDGGRRPPARTAQCRRSQDGGRRPPASGEEPHLALRTIRELAIRLADAEQAAAGVASLEPAGALTALEEHLAGCPDCAAEVEGWAAQPEELLTEESWDQFAATPPVEPLVAATDRFLLQGTGPEQPEAVLGLRFTGEAGRSWGVALQQQGAELRGNLWLSAPAPDRRHLLWLNGDGPPIRLVWEPGQTEATAPVRWPPGPVSAQALVFGPARTPPAWADLVAESLACAELTVAARLWQAATAAAPDRTAAKAAGPVAAPWAGRSDAPSSEPLAAALAEPSVAQVLPGPGRRGGTRVAPWLALAASLALLIGLPFLLRTPPPMRTPTPTFPLARGLGTAAQVAFDPDDGPMRRCPEWPTAQPAPDAPGSPCGWLPTRERLHLYYGLEAGTPLRFVSVWARAPGRFTLLFPDPADGLATRSRSVPPSTGRTDCQEGFCWLEAAGRTFDPAELPGSEFELIFAFTREPLELVRLARDEAAGRGWQPGPGEARHRFRIRTEVP